MKKIILLITIVFVFNSCHKENTNSNTPVILELVSGKVISPTEKPIPNALVFYENEDIFYSTSSNGLGEFRLEVPVGQGKLNIQTGNGKLFNSSIDINLQKGTPLILENDDLILNTTAKFAYLEGDYDKIENIVSGLGYGRYRITVSDIENNNLSNYDVIFLNCTALDPFNSMTDSFYNNLKDFVANGGSIYSSDYAIDYLIGETSLFLNCPYEPVGGFIADDLICGTKTGEIGVLENNMIVSTDLSNYLNTNTIDIQYDEGKWVELQNLNNDFWETLIIDENYNPLMIKTNAINGNNDESKWYSDNDNKVTICHIPPGNPDNPIEITINVNALDTHLAHGDTIGSCNGTSGNIYYTTFHNHIGGTPQGEIIKMMEFIILNL